MTDRPQVRPISQRLPSFERPPIIEVAISVQFDRIKGLNAAVLGLLWGQFKSAFPASEQHGPIADVREDFGPPKVSEVEISLTDLTQTPRFWFMNESGTRLLQVQATRFVLNWRKNETDEAYPRYSAIRQELASAFKVFCGFLTAEGIDAPSINQVELTYVNHFPAQSDGVRQPATRFVNLWAGEPQQSELPQADNLSFRARYTFTPEGLPAGRLHISCESKYRIADLSPLYALNLIFRGAPSAPTLEAALAFLDYGHERIVTSFTEVTTSEMHAAWGRTA